MSTIPPANPQPPAPPNTPPNTPTSAPAPAQVPSPATAPGSQPGVHSALGTNNPYHRFAPRPPQPTLHPRKVRGGIRIDSKTGPVSTTWSGQRWFRLSEEFAPNDQLAEGVNYARLGQARWFNVTNGHIQARVQGRLPGPYVVDIKLQTFPFEQWERVLDALASETKLVAMLLAGEVPASIEDVFAPQGLRLFPQEAGDITRSCTCSIAREMTGNVWCKHVCCAMAILAEKLGQDPFMIFSLRGLAREDLLERLRQRRVVAGATRTSGDRPIPAYVPRLPGISDAATATLEQSIDQFWTLNPDAVRVDLSIAPPAVTHPLLRRLGVSPFLNAKFPLVGLLATCYDVVSERAINGSMLAPGSQPGATDAPADQ
jgi:uncharacterized Zn finger protein